ncbi:MAG: hypothetical protein WKG52_00980 [Variovorax sp.]
MTTQSFKLLRPYRQAALVAVKREHCMPPTYRPAVDVKAELKCPRCGSRLPYFVRAVNGLSNGRCVASCGVEWQE